MIVPVSIKNGYYAALPIWEKIKTEADSILDDIAKRQGGNYTSRIKPLESAMLKIEKVEYERPFLDMEDMFAGSIIVPTITTISRTKDEIEGLFTIDEVRPKETPNPSVFDGTYDLHLILKLRDSPYRLDKSILKLRFEVQIKTLLQQAWASTSHDIIYKPKRLSYGLVRIASQIRALLELADSVLANIEKAAELQSEHDYPKYQDQKKIIEILEKYWEPARLPLDRRRATLIIQKYAGLANILIDNLDSILSRPRYSDLLKLRSVTPTQTIFMILFIEKDGNLPKLIKGNSKVLVTEEMLDSCSLLAKIPQANRIIV